VGVALDFDERATRLTREGSRRMQTQRFACAGNPWGSGVRFFLALWGRKLEESIQSASAILLGVLSTLPAANLFLESTSDTRGT
jgi:hypothetical protein